MSTRSIKMIKKNSHAPCYEWAFHFTNVNCKLTKVNYCFKVGKYRGLGRPIWTTFHASQFHATAKFLQLFYAQLVPGQLGVSKQNFTKEVFEEPKLSQIFDKVDEKMFPVKNSFFKFNCTGQRSNVENLKNTPKIFKLYRPFAEEVILMKNISVTAALAQMLTHAAWRLGNFQIWQTWQ